MSSSNQNNLFRPIGDIASATDALPDNIEAIDQEKLVQLASKNVDHKGESTEGQAAGFERGDGDDREVQQIESLCMECGKNVGIGCVCSHSTG